MMKIVTTTRAEKEIVTPIPTPIPTPTSTTKTQTPTPTTELPRSAITAPNALQPAVDSAKAKTLGRLLCHLCSNGVENFLDIKDCPSPEAKTQLLELCQAQSLQIARELIAQGADVNEDISKGKRNHVPNSPLIAAARHNNLPVVKLLISSGAKITPQAMQSAAGTKNLETTQYLLSKGGNPYHYGELDMPTHKWRQDFPDTTPIHDAILYYAEDDPECVPPTKESIKCIKLLLRYYRPKNLELAHKNGDLREETRQCIKEELSKRKIKDLISNNLELDQ